MLAILAAVAVPPAFAQGLPDLLVTRIDQLSDPAQRPATEPVTRPSTRAELDGAPNISLTITQPTPLRSVLQLLFRDTPFSTVLHSSVRGTFSGDLRNLTLRQALEAILFPAGLDHDLRGTVIRIFPRRPETRLYRVDLLAARRSWQSRSSAPGGVLATSIDSDPFAQLSDGVGMLLSSEGRHFVDRRAGIVHVTDFADRLDQIGVYLEAIQLRANRQLRVDVQVIRLAMTSGAAATPAPTWPSVATDAAQFIRTLEASGSVELIASPRLLTMNNEPATINVASGGGEERSITITPQISADGFVQLHVVHRIVDRSSAQPTVTESDAIVRVREGETAIVSGIPYAAETRQRTEILVLLKPSQVVPTPSSIAAQAGQR